MGSSLIKSVRGIASKEAKILNNPRVCDISVGLWGWIQPWLVDRLHDPNFEVRREQMGTADVRFTVRPDGGFDLDYSQSRDRFSHQLRNYGTPYDEIEVCRCRGCRCICEDLKQLKQEKRRRWWHS